MRFTVIHKEEGFALIAALSIVAILSVSTVPLLNLVAQNQKKSVEQRVTSHLYHEARENLELGVYLTKLSNGTPDYFSTTYSTEEADFANACERRVDVVSPDVLRNGTLSIVDNGSHGPFTLENSREAAVFVVNKGKIDDARFDNFLVISCARSSSGSMGLLSSELSYLRGSYFSLNLNQY